MATGHYNTRDYNPYSDIQCELRPMDHQPDTQTDTQKRREARWMRAEFCLLLVPVLLLIPYIIFRLLAG